MISFLRFTLERLLLRGVGYRLAFAALLIAAVALLAGLLMSLHPAFSGPLDAIWWAFLRLTDTGYLGDDEGPVRRSVSTLLTVAGAVLFIGMLIAILTQGITAWLQRVEGGLSALRIRGHVLILGWNYHTPIVILELLRTRERSQRFLANNPARALRVVVLASNVDAALRMRLRDYLGNHWNDSRVILRAGNPLQLEALRSVCFGDAAAVILPGADFVSARPGVSDVENIKALAAISHHGRSGGTVPTAVASLYRANRRGIIGAAYGGTVVTVESDLYIARMMAQSALTPGAWKVLEELFTTSSGNAIHLRDATLAPDQSLAWWRATRGASILIGVLRGDDGSVLLNAAPDTAIAGSDRLIYIAEHFADCEPTLAIGAMPAEATQSEAAATRAVTLAPARSAAGRLLILGYSRRVPPLVRELLAHRGAVSAITLVGTTPVAERDADLADLAEGRLTHKVVDFIDPDVIAALGPQDYDTVILVARESLGDEASADAASLANWLTLRALGITASGTRVLTEILEEENAALFDRARSDVVLSPVYVSYLLSQFALEPQLGDVYRELLQPWGANIELRRVEVAVGTELRFAQLQALAAERGELALAIRSPALNAGRALLNPAAHTSWLHSADDQLLVLAENRLP